MTDLRGEVCWWDERIGGIPVGQTPVILLEI